MTQPAQHHHPRLLRAQPFGPSAVGGVRIQAGALLLGGWSFEETTGAASAHVTIFDGGDNNGIRLATVALSSGQSTRDFFGGHFLAIMTGLFVQVDSGSVLGDLYLAVR